MAENFTPGETIALAVTASGVSAAFILAQSASYPDVMLTNAGSVTAFVGFGGAPAALPAAGALGATPVMPGETYVLRKGVGVTQVNALTQAGVTTLYATAGQGQ